MHVCMMMKYSESVLYTHTYFLRMVILTLKVMFGNQGKRSTERLKEDCAWEYSFVDLLSFKTFSRGALIAYISEDEK